MFEEKETLALAQCSRNLGEGSRCVHAADLLPTPPREAQGRSALEGKLELEVAFNYFSAAGMEKQEESIQSRELSEAELLRVGGSPTDSCGGGATCRKKHEPPNLLPESRPKLVLN